MHFVICDDQPGHNEVVIALLREIIADNRLDADISLVATTPQAVAAYARENLHDSIYLLDLDFEAAYSGLDLAKDIRQVDASSYIVYISAHQEYMLACYQTKASDFLLKPFPREQLEQCIAGIFRDRALIEGDAHLLVHIGSCTHYVAYREILFFEKQREYVILHRPGAPLKWRESYTDLEPRLSGGRFCRTHHGYIANLDHIQRYDKIKKTIHMHTGAVLPVSRTYRAQVESRLRENKDRR